MKLTKERLKKIIKEELKKVLNEAKLNTVMGMDLGDKEEAIKNAILNAPIIASQEFGGTQKFKTVAEMIDTLDIRQMTLTFDGGPWAKNKPDRRFSIQLPAFAARTNTGRALRVIYSDSHKELAAKGGNLIEVSKELDEALESLPRPDQK